MRWLASALDRGRRPTPSETAASPDRSSAVPPSPDGAQRLWALLLTSSVLYFFWNNEADNDLWGHLRFGRDLIAASTFPSLDSYTYTAAGQPWVNHEWLSQVVMAAVYGWAGTAGLLVSKFALAATTFLLLFAEVRRCTDSPHLRGAVGLLAIAVLARGMAPRPQVFTYCFIALTLLLLGQYSRGRRTALWWFPGIFLLWVNLHGGFVLGLAILGLFAGTDLLVRGKGSFTPWLAFLASALATAINPYGVQLFSYIINELKRPHPIGEWQPAAMEPAQFAFWAMFMLLCATLVYRRDWRRNGWQTVLAAGIGLLALRHQRHTPVFALCAAAPLASQLTAALRRIGPLLPFALSVASRRMIGAAMVVLALLQLGLAGKRHHESGWRMVYDPSEYPVRAVRALHAAGARGNLAVPLDWGEYVLWFLAPEIKVSLDGRFATVFPERVVEDNFNFFAGAPGWRRLIDAYPTQAALVPAGAPCPIRTLPDWRLAYRDRWAEVYVRSSAAESMGLSDLPFKPPAQQLPIGVFP